MKKRLILLMGSIANLFNRSLMRYMDYRVQNKVGGELSNIHILCMVKIILYFPMMLILGKVQ